MMNCIHRCKSCAVPVLIYKVQLKYQVSNKEIILLIWVVIACTVPAKNCLPIWPDTNTTAVATHSLPNTGMSPAGHATILI